MKPEDWQARKKRAPKEPKKWWAETMLETVFAAKTPAEEDAAWQAFHERVRVIPGWPEGAVGQARERWAQLGGDPAKWRDPPAEYLERDPVEQEERQRRYLG